MADPFLDHIDQPLCHPCHFHQRTGEHEEWDCEQDEAMDPILEGGGKRHQRRVSGDEVIKHAAEGEDAGDRDTSEEGDD